MLDSQIVYTLGENFVKGLSALDICERIRKRTKKNIEYNNILCRCERLLSKGILLYYINHYSIKIYKLVIGL